MESYGDVQCKLYEVIVETKELHRIDSYAIDEKEALSKALDLLDEDIPLSNRNVSYNVMDVLLKDY